MRPKYDMLWKGMIEVVMEPDRPGNTRVVDKLVKIFLRDGTERWILLHIEIQGRNIKDFPKRMFEYFIRLSAKHHRPIAAVAVLTGKNGSKVPASYEQCCLWTRNRYEYKTLCLSEIPELP